MRLDHLLSTEFFRTPVWRPSCGPCAGDRLRSGVGVLVWKRSLASRVLGALRGVVWVCFWVPGPPPASVLGACGFPDAPGGTPSALRAVGRFRSGAWWFENWIVDASNAMIDVIVCFIAISPGSFLESGFEIDRFVIIFYSVMICRLAFEAIIGFFGACAALKGVWWMPWQTVPMKDV